MCAWVAQHSAAKGKGQAIWTGPSLAFGFRVREPVTVSLNEKQPRQMKSQDSNKSSANFIKPLYNV